MNTGRFRNLLVTTGFAVFIVMLAVVANSSRMTEAQEAPPQPLKGPISNAEQALAQAMYFDSVFARHPRAIERADIEPPILTTRQAYADSRGTGEGFTDPRDANLPVWVVTVKGEANLFFPGAFPDRPYIDITYIISAETGELAGVVTR
jgi:hypothetical protein